MRGTDNQTYYTRNGAFTWSQYGNGQTILTDSQGNPVMDTNGNIIAVPAGVSAEKMSFGEDGAVGYMTAQGNYINLNQRIAVYQLIIRQVLKTVREPACSNSQFGQSDA